MFSRLAFVALLFTVLACSDNSVRHLPDAPPGDGHEAIDAPSIDAPPGKANVTVTANGSGVFGVVVYFQAANATAVDTEMTDANGNATGSLGEGGFITAIDPAPVATEDVVAAAMTDYLYTWANVLPGDHVYYATTNATAAFTLMIPTLGSASDYVVQSTCTEYSETSPPVGTAAGSAYAVTLTLENCTGPQDFEIVATDGEGNALASFAAAGQTVAANGTLDLSGSTYVSATTRSYTYTDYSDDESVVITDGRISAHGVVYSPNYVLYATGSPATATGPVPVTTPYMDAVSSEVYEQSNDHYAYEWGQNGATYSTDWGAHVLPDYTGQATYDTPSHTLTFPFSGSAAGATPNIYAGGVGTSRSSDGHVWYWTAIGADSPMVFPVLPTTTYDWNVGSADTVTETEEIELAVPGDADAARSVAFAMSSPFALATGSAGILSENSYRVEEESIAVRGGHRRAQPARRATALHGARLPFRSR